MRQGVLLEVCVHLGPTAALERQLDNALHLGNETVVIHLLALQDLKDGILHTRDPEVHKGCVHSRKCLALSRRELHREVLNLKARL